MKPDLKMKLPLTDPGTGKPLAARAQPGYYPGFSTMKQKSYWDGATRAVVEKRLQEQEPLRFFAPEEAATLEAVTARILPQDDRTPDRRIPILPSLDERLFTNRLEGYRYADMPPDQEAYRLSIRAFTQMAEEVHGRRFEELDTLEQEYLLRSVHKAEPAGARDLWAQMNIERFWALLVADVCSVYYAHPWAWDEVGFGGPAYPRGYMRLEDGEPEPWEVDESRYAWAAPTDTISDHVEPHGKGDQHQTPHGEGGTH